MDFDILSKIEKYQIVKDNYNGISHWYDSELNGSIEFAKQLQEFTSFLQPGAKVLDVGAGTGEETAWIAKNAAEVTALDISAKMLAVLQRKYPEIKTKEGNMVDQLFEEAEFDGIWSARAIIHIPPEDLLRVLKQFKRVLKTKGVLSVIFAIPKDNNLQEQLIPEPEAPGKKNLLYYRTLYPLLYMYQCLENMGFSIRKQGVLINKMGKGETNAYLLAVKK